jgi:hypothetical protein
MGSAQQIGFATRPYSIRLVSRAARDETSTQSVGTSVPCPTTNNSTSTPSPSNWTCAVPRNWEPRERQQRAATPQEALEHLHLTRCAYDLRAQKGPRSRLVPRQHACTIVCTTMAQADEGTDEDRLAMPVRIQLRRGDNSPLARNSQLDGPIT